MKPEYSTLEIEDALLQAPVLVWVKDQSALHQPHLESLPERFTQGQSQE